MKALDELVDRQQVSVVCASINVKAIPKYNPEELDDSSMIQRIINVEKRLEQHSARLDENYARVADTKNDLEASSRCINNIQNEVQTSIKIANEAKECVDTHNSNVDDLINKIENNVKPTFAKVTGESRFNAQNAGSSGSGSGSGSSSRPGSDDADDAGGPWDTAGGRRGRRSNALNVAYNARPSNSATGDTARNTAQRRHTDSRQRADSNLHNRNAHRRSPFRYGTTRDAGQGRGLGAPLPSRFVVLERVMKDRAKQDIHDYMDLKNKELKTNIPVRSIKLMTKPESSYKKFLDEFSLEHYDIVRREEF